MSKLRAWLFFLTPIMLAGCVQSPVHPASTNGNEQPLQHWVEYELAPYLAEQLGRHPRFKGEPIVLVRLEGPDVQADIDALTQSIRDQIQDVLLSAPGVRLPWQPRQPLQRHHRRLASVQCRPSRDAHYFVGIEIAATANGEFRVSVRALDVDAGEWVSGFGKSWVGILTSRERRALQVHHTDESLRGLRVLPFASGEADLAAAYLANNLSCLLRQQAQQDLLLYVEPPQTPRSELRTLLELTGNNLARYREVRVTDASKEADFLLREEVHEIRPGLYQVWVVLHPKRSGEHLKGMDTATYVQVRPAQLQPTARTRTPKTPLARPAISRLELIGTPAPGEDACADTYAGGRISAGRSLRCQVLRLTARRSDEVFVFAYDPAAGLVRLSPGVCHHGAEPTERASVKHSYVFPPVQATDAGPGTIYAVAVTGSDLETRFTRLLQTLPDACRPGRKPRLQGQRRARWLSELDALIADNGRRLAWTARRIGPASRQHD